MMRYSNTWPPQKASYFLTFAQPKCNKIFRYIRAYILAENGYMFGNHGKRRGMMSASLLKNIYTTKKETEKLIVAFGVNSLFHKRLKKSKK
jgi:hypothetical protein